MRIRLKQQVFCSQEVGNAISSDFSVSVTAEMLLLLFSTLRPWPKHRFLRFSFFGHGRNAAFVVFDSSAVAETPFSSFFTFRPRPKRCFCCFLLVGHGRKSIFAVFSHFIDRRRAIFSIFWLSKGLDSRFLDRIHVFVESASPCRILCSFI